MVCMIIIGSQLESFFEDLVDLYTDIILCLLALSLLDIIILGNTRKIIIVILYFIVVLDILGNTRKIMGKLLQSCISLHF